MGSVSVNANVCDSPVPELGDTDVGAGGPALTPVIVSDAVVLCCKAPLVPVTVIVKLDGATPVVEIVSVVEPEPLTVVGLKAPVTPDGNPDTPKLATPENPLLPVIVTVYVGLAPATTVPGPAAMPIVKSGGGATLIV